ncbi:MAG: beta-propeller domain-containing protein, partial [Chloroflexi bacterium]|nr:beta-propeller domain-containing protein [Chloroflexota bacterium]
AEGEVTFRLPQSLQLEVLRVRADAAEALPSFFYRGANSFSVQADAGNQYGTIGLDFALAAGDFTIPLVPATVPSVAVAVGLQIIATPRDVVESDIWKIRGDTLYFFNQYRGLQVIDISQPASPVVRGTFALPAAGEQMYLLESNHVVLLARSGCGSSSQDESSALVLDVADGTPKLVAALSIPGSIQESRMVGAALYVASQTYRPVPGSNGSSWEWGTLVSAFDLANPAAPVARETLWYPGASHTIAATDRFLFIASADSADGRRSGIRCIDITSPNGTMQFAATVTAAGRVNDKFKIHLEGDLLTVISYRWDERRRWVTTLENFSLANPAAPEKVGSLDLAEGEQLHATRFDGRRAYIVTFLRIDPLWIVDLSDPADPRIAGELQVPGWSTYIEPLGNRLVAIGIDNTNGWRVAVSLFDVQDSARPALLSKVLLGENHSWSEANSDEKAFRVLPEAGLILVPYQGNTTNGYASRVRLIDLSADALTTRGAIEHQFQPRRATVHRDFILSIAGREMLSVDAANRDQPIVKAETELAWTVNRVFVQGDYLVELENESQGTASNQVGPTLRVSQADDTDQVLNRLGLTSLFPIVGAAVRDGHLYVAQAQKGGWPAMPRLAIDGSENVVTAVTTNPPTLITSVLDLRGLPEITLLGQAEAAVGYIGWNVALEAVWPRPGLLVWSGGAGGGYVLLEGFRSGVLAPPPPPPMPITTDPMLPVIVDPGAVSAQGTAVAAVDAAPTRQAIINAFTPVSVVLPVWYYIGGYIGSAGRLFAFNVQDAGAPRFVSKVNLSTNNWSSFSQSMAAEDLLYLSHLAYESEVVGTNYSVSTQPVFTKVTNVVTRTNYISVPETRLVTNLNTVIRTTWVTNLTTVTNVETLTNYTYVVAKAWLGEPAGGTAGNAAIASRGYHNLALKPDGSVWAWGGNWLGQLGDGSTSGRASLAPVPGLNDISAVAAGTIHSLALKADGTVWAWGADMFGQLGDGLPETEPNLPPLPEIASSSPVQVKGLGAVKSIFAGHFHSLAVLSDGSVWAWGNNQSGQLGDGSARNQAQPVLLSGLTGVKTIAAGSAHNLALKSDGAVWAWGDNQFGQLGNGTTNSRPAPVLISTPSETGALAAGRNHSLALQKDGRVLAWGENQFGQLGDGTTADQTNPTPVAGLDQVVSVAAGDGHSLALKADGTVWAWGSNESGQLGVAAPPDSSLPQPVLGVAGGIAVAAGANHSLALTGDGRMLAWGDNRDGQSGEGGQIAFTNLLTLTNLLTRTNLIAVTNHELVTNVTVVTSYVTFTNYTTVTNYDSVITYVKVTNATPVVRWMQRHYLDVVDYSDPLNPTVRKPVNIPGELRGLSHAGALLYTVGPSWTTNRELQGTEWLAASAYDGVAASLVDAMALPNAWPRPVLVQAPAIFLGQPGATNTPPLLETWALSMDTGRFTQLGSLELDSPANSLTAWGSLLAGQEGNRVRLFNAADPAALDGIGVGELNGCLSFSLAAAGGSVGRGLFIPLHEYGVWKVGSSNAPARP